jgi:soluble lytic murein transglycosylase
MEVAMPASPRKLTLSLPAVSPRTGRKALLAALLTAVSCGAFAQSMDSQAPAPVQPPAPIVAPVPYAALSSALQPSDASLLRQALLAARRGDTTTAQGLQAEMTNPIAKRLVTWAMVDSAGTNLDYFTLVNAMRELNGWPRPSRLRGALEKALETTAIPPDQVIAIFQGRDPETPQGAIALAAAYQASGRTADASALVKHVWRNHAFGADLQNEMLGRFSGVLTSDDHAARLEMLLYTGDTTAARALLGFVTPDQRALAEARMAFRAERSDASLLLGAVPPALQSDPGLAFDRARYYRKHNLETIAAGLVRSFPTTTPEQAEVTKAIWAERRALMFAALQSLDYRGAYAAADDDSLQPGADRNEAEFFAGWIALAKLKNADLADQHFAKLQAGATTPITTSRAFYWRGRAAQAKGDMMDANLYWGQGAKYYTAFYGQLSAAKIGQAKLELGTDPVPTAADRARFEGRDVIRAARMLGDAGDHQLLASFAMAAEEDIDSAAEMGLLVDLCRMYADQSLSMRVVRAAAMRGIYLPQRGYPVRMAPVGYGLAEPAFAFAITRQESSFDPMAHNPSGARGMMQLLPATAAGVARGQGLPFSTDRLYEADYNMKLGAAYLGQLTQEFDGSYVLAAAAYNAGPGRPPQWIAACGDPRGGNSDPADFIECIPFSETRDYVMRVMEGVEIYRARLAGGTAPLTIAADLKRGGWTPSVVRPAMNAYAGYGQTSQAVTASAGSGG